MFEYQTAGSDFLANGGILLADEPGLGKTRQALMAAQTLGCRTILVVCPAIAVGVWQSEVAKWRPDLTAQTIREILKAKVYKATDRVVIVSYDHLVTPKAKAVRQLIGGLTHELLICDEAHALKNPTAKRTMLIYGAHCAGGEGSLIGRCGRTILLTGTPTLNHAGEWYTHLRALASERIEQRSYDAFVTRYCIKGVRTVRTRTGRQVSIETIEGSNRATVPDLVQRMRGFWLKRKVVDVLPDLPPLRIEVRRLPVEYLDTDKLHEAEQSPEAEQLLRALADRDAEALRELEGHLAKLRRLLALAKVNATIAWAQGALDAGEPKIAVFGWHVEALQQIWAGLQDVGAVMITGATTRRDEIVSIFQNDPECRAGVFQIQAAGTALTMTACRRVIMAEQAWTPALNLQAIKRCHRLGSTNAVLAEVLVAPGLDEIVGEILARKIGDIAAIEGDAA